MEPLRPEDLAKPLPQADSTSESMPELIRRLAMLNPLEYDQIRGAEAERIGVRVSTLDEGVQAQRKNHQEPTGRRSLFQEVHPWEGTVNPGDLLDEIHATIRRHIICDWPTAIAAVLWIAFTWFIDVVQVAPLAVITAPEKRCGKSQLLDLIGRLSRNPMMASNISPAAVFRVIEACRPTLLIDEADTFLKENEELRGVINSGHTRQAAQVVRTVGDDHEPRLFSTWGAKALSGIGHPPETLMDRAIVLALRRKLPTEACQRLRHADPSVFSILASKLARFAEDAASAIAIARPNLPDELNDRAQDNWEPLLAIADHAGGEWPTRAREAAKRISGAGQEPRSIAEELLADIQEVFDNTKKDRLSTVELLAALTKDDLKPWASFSRGSAMSPKQLSNMLKGFNIAPGSIRLGFKSLKGYYRHAFDDAFQRYLGQMEGVGTVTAAQANGGEDLRVPDSFEVPAQRLVDTSHITAANTGVTGHSSCDDTLQDDGTCKPASVLDCAVEAPEKGCPGGNNTSAAPLDGIEMPSPIDVLENEHSASMQILGPNWSGSMSMSQ